jgi:signal transduction histidine kinase
LNTYSEDLFSSEPVTPRSDKIISLLETENGQLWCGSNQGITYLFDEHKKTFTRKHEPSNGVSGFQFRVVHLMIDKTKNLWIGTDPDGLYKIDLKAKPFNHTFSDPKIDHGLKSNFIKCFLQVKDEIYVATYDKGINVFNVRDGSFRYINGFNNVSDNFPIITSMVADSSGEIFVGTDEGIAVIKKGTSFLTRLSTEFQIDRLKKLTNTLYLLPDQSLLVGTQFGLYELKKNKDSFEYIPFALNEYVEDILVDQSGNLWVGSVKALYFSEKTSTGFSTNLKLVTNTIGRVKCICQSAKGTIWVGTVDGLYKIKAREKIIEKTYSEKNGLPNTFIYGITEDKNGYLWLSTNRGLSKFNPEKETFRNYTVSDGLQSNEFNTGAYYETTSGELFFGGINGFNHFFPERIQNNPFVPECILTNLKIFDQPFVTDTSIEFKKHITVDYTRNNLLFEYVALEFSDPSKNNFKYRLLGLDSNWVNAGKERFARFVNLGPGEYTFQVKAANNDGIWNNQPCEFRITITPPFWKTLSFIFSVIIIGGVLLFLIIRSYLRFQLRIKTREQSVRMNAIIKTEEKERKRIAGELHDGLGQLLSTARLNVAGFEDSIENKNNILLKNSLQLLDEACAEVRTISHNMMPGALIRLGLMAAVNELINKINDTEKIRIEYDTNLEERFSETIEIAIYRIVQEALNNMLRHAEAKIITVKIQKSGNELQISIADDGKSFDVSEIQNSDGLGWRNIYSRVELINGTISVQSEKGKGTSIFITIPLS